MKIPEELKYTRDHEWIRVTGNQACIGITDYAQSELGEIVYLDINTQGQTIPRQQPFGTIEAVKTVSDLFMPVSGQVLQTNPALQDSPELVNQDPYGEGWIIKITLNDPAELDLLLTSTIYQQLVSPN